MQGGLLGAGALSLDPPRPEEPELLEQNGIEIPSASELFAPVLAGVRARRGFLGPALTTHSSTLAWKIPWTKEPGRLQSMGSQRLGHD